MAVLAGGRGRRIGGDKALVPLLGQALISYPIAAARAAGLSVVVVAKRATRLPALGVDVLLEPDTPLHPLVGIITALEHHDAIIAIPCDMPFLKADTLAALAAAPGEVATLWPGLPLPALYRRALLPRLEHALEDHASLRSTQAGAASALPAATHAREQMAVNTPADLTAAERLLRAR